MLTERTDVPGRRGLRLAMLLAFIVPGYVAALGWLNTYGPGGMFDDILGIAFPALVGPVGIVRIAAASLDSRARPFFALVGYLSVMLFLFNLLPIPALDGGRLIFLLAEVVSRRRVNPKFDAVVNTAGLVLLLGLFLIITVKELILG